MDSKDLWLVIGASVSVGLFGICMCANVIRQCKHPRIKESRSDNDLASMIEQGESS